MLSSQNSKLKIFSAFLPAIFTVVAAVVTIIIYATVLNGDRVSTYLAVALVPLFPFACVIANLKWRLGIPQYLMALICLHIIFAVDCGTTMGFYGKFAWWDLFVHGFFGFLGCDTLYYLYMRLEGKRPNLIYHIVIILLTISLAAIWEIYEFVAGLLLNIDMQGVGSALALGKNPLADTITDIVIALAGVAVFYALLLCKRLFYKKKTVIDEDID